MGYPGMILIFNEKRIWQWLEDAKNQEPGHFLEEHRGGFAGDFDAASMNEHLKDFRAGTLKDGDFFLYDLISLSGAKEIDLYEFNYFEFTGIFGYLAKRHSTLTYDKEEPVIMDKGLIVLEHLLVTPLEIFGLSVGRAGGGGIRGYVGYEALEKEGRDAVRLLQGLELDERAVQEIEEEHIKDYKALSGFERGAVESLFGAPVESSDEPDPGIYESAKKKIIMAINMAMEKRMGIIIAGF